MVLIHDEALRQLSNIILDAEIQGYFWAFWNALNIFSITLNSYNITAFFPKSMHLLGLLGNTVDICSKGPGRKGNLPIREKNLKSYKSLSYLSLYCFLGNFSLLEKLGRSHESPWSEVPLYPIEGLPFRISRNSGISLINCHLGLSDCFSTLLL